MKAPPIEAMVPGGVLRHDHVHVVTNDRTCSRCRLAIPEDAVPLMLWGEDGHNMLIYCDACTSPSFPCGPLRARFRVVGGAAYAGGLVYLVDVDDGAMSITNDAEAVVAWCYTLFGFATIVYRDSEGRWDQLVHDKARFRGFAPWYGPTPALD